MRHHIPLDIKRLRLALKLLITGNALTKKGSISCSQTVGLCFFCTRSSHRTKHGLIKQKGDVLIIIKRL